jgi:hypothetical protein
MENFSFESYRDNLAKKLKETKAKEGKDALGKKLDEARESDDYQVAKKLHNIKKKLPDTAIQEVAGTFQARETEDDLSSWDVVDIADKIPQEFKYLIDADFLRLASAKINNDEDRDKISDQIAIATKTGYGDLTRYERNLRELKLDEIIDEIMDGDYLNKRTFNHVVTGMRSAATTKYANQHFDRHSKIESSKGLEYGKNGFWMCNGHNLYSIVHMSPIVSLSPDNLAAHLFFENSFYPPIEIMLEHIKMEHKWRKDRSYEYPRVRSEDAGENNLARLYFLAGLPLPGSSNTLGYFFAFESGPQTRERAAKGNDDGIILDTSWADISECILDWKTGKAWKRKHSEEELNEVKKRQAFYRKWIEENLLK